MKQIYRFEQAAPPVLTEAMLRQRLALKRQARLLALAGILSQLCVLALAGLLYAAAPGLALLCLGYAAVSLVGCLVLILVFSRKRRFLLS